MKLTRREVTAAMLAGQAVRLPGAQQATNQSADAELKAARERLKSNADALSAIKLPMATEPAFQFKA